MRQTATRCNAKIERVELFSSDGRLIKTTTIDSNNLDFSKLSKGLCILKIYTRSGVFQQKVLK